MKSIRLLFLIIITTFISCGDIPNTFYYVDIYDKDSNLVYKYNPKDSTAIIFLDNDYRYMTGKFINSKCEGVWKEYITEDNRLDFKWTYKNNLREGIYYGYTLTGKIETVGHYKNDQLSGVLVYFDLKQRPEKVQVWKGITDREGASVLVYEKKLK